MSRIRLSLLMPTLLLALPLAAAGCLTNFDQGPGPVTPPSVELTGSYSLEAFDIYYYLDSSGTIPGGYLNELDFASFGGFMSIDRFTSTTGGVSQAIARNNVTEVDWIGTYVILTPGIFTVTPSLGSPFSLTVTPGAGNGLTTQTQLFFDPGLGRYYTEIDYWRKYSDTP